MLGALIGLAVASKVINGVANSSGANNMARTMNQAMNTMNTMQRQNAYGQNYGRRQQYGQQQQYGQSYGQSQQRQQYGQSYGQSQQRQQYGQSYGQTQQRQQYGQSYTGSYGSGASTNQRAAQTTQSGQQSATKTTYLVCEYCDCKVPAGASCVCCGAPLSMAKAVPTRSTTGYYRS